MMIWAGSQVQGKLQGKEMAFVGVNPWCLKEITIPVISPQIKP